MVPERISTHLTKILFALFCIIGDFVDIGLVIFYQIGVRFQANRAAVPMFFRL